MSDLSSLRTSPSLLARLREHPSDPSAWELFVARYQPRLLEWCRHWGLQDADCHDICQTVLLRLAAKLRVFAYDSTQSFRGWLYTLTRHAWADFVADLQKRVQPADPAAALQELAAREDLESRLKDLFDLELLEESLARVKARVEEKTWEAFRRTTLVGESATEVACVLNMPLASVFKAKSNVRKMVQDVVKSLESPEVLSPV